MPIPEIHIHFPANINFGQLTSTQARDTPEVEFSEDQEVGELSPSAFKTESDYSSWEF